MNPSRRRFIRKSTLAGVALPLGLGTTMGAEPKSDQWVRIDDPKYSYTINIFSKHLQWLGYEEMADQVAAMGFDGIDLTVRPEGHVLPERVEKDLPRAIAAIRKRGLQVPMITTGINGADSPFAESILKTAGSLGVAYYRTGSLEYDGKLSMEENLKSMLARFTNLEKLNRRYGIQGHHQNHSGAGFGAPLWDLWNVLKEIKSPWMGSQYDILHATVEGAHTWPLSLKLLGSFIGTMDIKDFQWIRKDGQWDMEYVPLGQGLVDFKTYFSLLKTYQIKGPFSIHFEYPIGGAEHGARRITTSREDIIAFMKRDLAMLRNLISAAGL